jgi:hypothetical protein
MRKWVGLTFFCGAVAAGCNCGQTLGECLGTAIGSALGQAISVGLSEAFRTESRADDARWSGAKLWVTGAHDNGRLIITFDGPAVSGALPRQLMNTDGGCESRGDFAYIVRKGDAGVTETLSAMLSVMPSVNVDGGTLFSLSSVFAVTGDGGMRPVPARDLDVVVPPMP